MRYLKFKKGDTVDLIRQAVEIGGKLRDDGMLLKGVSEPFEGKEHIVYEIYEMDSPQSDRF